MKKEAEEILSYLNIMINIYGINLMENGIYKR
jgi:hypothetical protein